MNSTELPGALKRVGLEKSWLGAARIALIEFLERETKISWRYYDNTIDPSNSNGVGGVKIFRTGLFNPEQETWIRDHSKKNVTLQLRLLISHHDADECEGLMCDWESFIDNLMKRISFNGMTGRWRDVDLHNAWMGLHSSTRGNQFASQEIPSPQGEDDKLYQAVLLCEYLCPYEVGYVNGNFEMNY